MPGRKYSSNGSYRYGFNGKEQDKDISNLTAYDYGFRIYNPALGRFLSVDPLFKSYPWYTPYQFAGNKPMIAIDLDGLEERIIIEVTGSKIKPAIQKTTCIDIFDKLAVNVAAINIIASQLQLKEIQQKQLVAPSSNNEWGAGRLTPKESKEIIDETISQFTLWTSSTSTYSQSPDLSVVTESYTRTYSFNYSLLGDEETIKKVKAAVTVASTMTEYGSGLSGSKVLEKISTPASVATSLMNGDNLAVTETIAKSLAKRGLIYGASKLTGTAVSGATKTAIGTAVGILALTLTNSGPTDVIDMKENATKNLRNRTISALIFLFEKNNTPAVKPILMIPAPHNDHLVPILHEPLTIPAH